MTKKTLIRIVSFPFMIPVFIVVYGLWLVCKTAEVTIDAWFD